MFNNNLKTKLLELHVLTIYVFFLSLLEYVSYLVFNFQSVTYIYIYIYIYIHRCGFIYNFIRKMRKSRRGDMETKVMEKIEVANAFFTFVFSDRNCFFSDSRCLRPEGKCVTRKTYISWRRIWLGNICMN